MYHFHIYVSFSLPLPPSLRSIFFLKKKRKMMSTKDRIRKLLWESRDWSNPERPYSERGSLRSGLLRRPGHLTSEDVELRINVNWEMH